MSTDTTTTTRRRLGMRLAAAGAVAVAAGAALTGCSVLAMDAWAVSYEVAVVSGDASGMESTLAYADRETRQKDQQTITQQQALTTTPVVIESLAALDESVSVSATGIPGTVLSCAIKLDGERVLAEQVSAPGEPITCEATTPASLDD